MAEPKNNDFLDDLADMEAEEFEKEIAEMEPEAIELDSLRAERDQYKDRFKSITGKEAEGSSKEARILILEDALQIFLENPLGVGLASSIRGRSPMVDGFGLIAFASLFPMIFVMAYGMLY